MLYMRRVFVIFLIFLFPLNVLALSMSISSMPPAGSTQSFFAPAHADAETDTCCNVDPGSQAVFDIDPDEPPTGSDFHDWVSREARPQSVALPEESISSLVPSPRGLSPFPPLKPPPLA
jgi:hypothetical protein